MHEIPKTYLTERARAAFSGDRPEAVIDPRIVKWFNSWSGSTSALVIGPSGCGKTLGVALAASTTWQWAIRRPGVQSSLTVSRRRPTDGVRRSVQVTRWVRADQLSGLSSELKTFTDAPVLVIDELGYDRFDENILKVLGVRSEMERLTLVTSGDTYDRLEARYSDATLRRLTRHLGGTLIDCHSAAPKIKLKPAWPEEPELRLYTDGSVRNTVASERIKKLVEKF